MARVKDSSIDMIDFAMEGFKAVKSALEEAEKRQREHAKATYQGLTASGKARYVTSITESTGSQSATAEMLDISRSRVNQLIKSEKNRKNGK